MNSNMAAFPSLSQLYLQKSNYLKHKRKLSSITSQIPSPRSCQNQSLQLNKFRKKIQSHASKNCNKSYEIARQNQAIARRIIKMKSTLNLGVEVQSGKKNQLFRWRLLSGRDKMQERQLQNLRMSSKLKSAGPSISCGDLRKDYQKSWELRNRLTHYKVKSNNKVVLKLDRYVEQSQHIPSKIDQEILNRVHQYKQKRQQALQSQSFSTPLIKNKLGAVLAAGHLKYTNRGAMKSKVDLDRRLRQLAQQRRQKGWQNLQTKEETASGVAAQPSDIFSTEPNIVIKPSV